MARLGGAIDLAVVIAFVAIGRSTHRHGLGVAGMASTAWPFLCGLAIGWALVLCWSGRSRATSLRSGLGVGVCTVAVAMVLRVVSGQGTAAAFVLVALAFLGGAMLAWRAVLAVVRRARGAQHGRPVPS